MKKTRLAKVKAFLLKNLPLKILAFVLAIIIWIIIVNVDDPVKSKTISGIAVDLLNEEMLIEKGYTYEVKSGGSLSIVVKAPQTVVDELKSSDFYAYADLSTRTDNDSCKIYVSCIKEDVVKQVDIVSLRTEYVKLNLDNKISKEFPIITECIGEPEEGYVVSGASTSPSTIKVTGAETTINTIDHVSVKYDITNMNQSVTENVAPVFYDVDGHVVDTGKLEMSRNSVKLSITILPTKWVEVHYALRGDMPEGYAVESVSENITSVQIAGRKDELATIDAIDIPADVIDISNLTADETKTIPLLNYLPSQYIIVSDTKTLEVTIKVEQIRNLLLEVPVSNIEIRNTEDGFAAEIIGLGESGQEVKGAKSIPVTVSGRKDTVDTLTAEALNASLSVSGKGTGTFSIKLAFADHKDYKVEGEYYALVRIAKVKTEEETTPPQTQEETTENAGDEGESVSEETSQTEDEPTLPEQTETQTESSPETTLDK